MHRAWLARPGDPIDEDELTRFGNVDDDSTA
jgi:hypothetical protein